MSQFDDKEKLSLSTIYFKVSGRVQGVFFRASTKSMADQYEIKGWVKNNPDGDVEGIATGDITRLTLFREWLKRGPDMAKVLRFEVIDYECQIFEKFEIR
ncbi:MAG: acylphosphatase [Gammaproteobacteria bacterium]|jgi:acylphosphatase